MRCASPRSRAADRRKWHVCSTLCRSKEAARLLSRNASRRWSRTMVRAGCEYMTACSPALYRRRYAKIISAWDIACVDFCCDGFIARRKNWKLIDWGMRVCAVGVRRHRGHVTMTYQDHGRARSWESVTFYSEKAVL